MTSFSFVKYFYVIKYATGSFIPAMVQVVIDPFSFKGSERSFQQLRRRNNRIFYMVGRMGDQSVVIRAEKGKVEMIVDDYKER